MKQSFLLDMAKIQGIFHQVNTNNIMKTLLEKLFLGQNSFSTFLFNIIGQIHHMLNAKPQGSDFGFMKFNPDGQSLVYYFDDDILKEKALKDNAYKLKYSIATNNITLFGSNLGDWKFSSKIIDLTPPIRFISTYSTKFHKLTFECLRYSEPNRQEFMKELLVSIKQFIYENIMCTY